MKVATLFATAMILAATSFAGGVNVTDLSADAKAFEVKLGGKRTADLFTLTAVPEEFKGATCVSIKRGSTSKPGSGFSFTIDKPCTVYLLYMVRGKIVQPEGWDKTPLTVQWKYSAPILKDVVFKKAFPAGKVEIPVNNSNAGSYGIPHMAVLIPTE
jgi:hypothetical protein